MHRNIWTKKTHVIDTIFHNSAVMLLLPKKLFFAVKSSKPEFLMKYSQIKYIDNKMSQICGYFEPINSTKSALFKSVMALYSTFSTSF